MKIAVFGAGMVGRTIAIDLSKNYTVTSFDLSEKSLAFLKEMAPQVNIRKLDLANTSLYETELAPFDLVITAVPGFMGYTTLEAVIRCGKNVVDISFFPEDSLQLDALAKEKNVTVITDCGVAPGMNNWIVGYYDSIMKVESMECYVGGLPKHPKMPFKYKAPFSPIDVIEEYTRPARLYINGEIVTKPALSEREILQFAPVGELEAFNTDGLRSLLYTLPHIPNMKEKTLRYKGHIDLIVALQQSGFFNTKEEIIGDQKIRPIDLTAKLLLKEWKLEPKEAEFTVMKVIVKGEGKTIEYNMYDEYDAATDMSSMSRTTGFTCTAAANLIVKKMFVEKGVFPPELVAPQEGCFAYVLNYLQERAVNWIRTEY